MTDSILTFHLENLTATEAFAARLAMALIPGDVIYLEGDLGAGKTTLTRALLRTLGVQGSITSPTYALIEPYSIPYPTENDHVSPEKNAELTLLHCDLYRLTDPEELEYIGVRELFTENSIAFIEWPKRGAGFIPEPTIQLTLQHLLADLDTSDNARELTLMATTTRYPIIRSQLVPNNHEL